MTRRTELCARVLAIAASSALVNAQLTPTTEVAPSTQPSSAPSTQLVPVPVPAPMTAPASQATSMPATQSAIAPMTRPAPAVPASRPVTVIWPSTRPSTRPAQKITLEFKDASVDTVLDYLSEAAGFIVVKDGPISGKVTVTSRGEGISSLEALTLLNAVLKINGFTAIQQGRVLKVVKIPDSKKMNIPVFFGADPKTIAETDEMITQVIPVKNVDAAKLRQDLQPLVSGDADFAANQGSNSLIITDTSANILRIVKIVYNLDKNEAASSSMLIKHLSYANASAAAKLIASIFGAEQNQNAQGGGGGPGRFFQRMMMGGGGPGGGGPGGGGGAAGGSESGKATGKVTAAADDRTNTLVVVASPDTLVLIDKLITALDADPAASSEVRVFQLNFADADSAAKLINSVFEPTPQQNRGGGGGGGEGPRLNNISSTEQGARVSAAAADRSNTLVVTAPPETLKLIGTILSKLDSDPAAMSEVKVFQLKYADSASAAKLINSIFQSDATTSNGGGGGGGGRRAGGGADGQLPAIGGLASGLHGGHVSAASDDRTNTLVVTAPSDAMKIVGGVLRELDANPSAESAFFIYHLRNGQAANLQNVLNTLFGANTNGSTNTNASNNRTSGQSLVSSGLGSNGGFGSSGAGGRGGSGGAFGSGSSGAFGSPLTSTNSNRTNNSSLNSTGGNVNAGGTRAYSELTGQVFVVADPDTNSLLVTTASKYQDQVKKIVAELDRPVPQVLIKVLVAEVTHERTNDFGLDFSILDTRASGNGLKVGQSLGNAAAASNGGLVVSLMETNLNATLHALATQGKLDVLSRPYILASDNQQASITVGQEVPFITNTQVNITGQQINTITYQAVGIILNVTPHINPDGVVTLDVAPEISQLTGTTVPIGAGVSAPVIANRSAQSRVAIRNGNTIVIGGMMQDQKTTTINKIPLLGDIPILGQLFTRYQDDRSKTELLIFLTPHVAQQPDSLKPMSEDEVKGTKLTPHAVEPGDFEEHIRGLNRGATPHGGTTRPAATDIVPTPSTQPLQGVTISAPATTGKSEP